MPHSPAIDTTQPHSARVWNYWLDGKDHYPVDRELGDQILDLHPKIAVDARAGRAFLMHTVALLAREEEGATAFVDHDLRETGRVLERSAEVLDLDRPVALSAIGTLGHTPTLSEAVDLVRAYTDALPSGSFLVLADAVLPDRGSAAEALDEWNREAAPTCRGRTPEGFASYFEGLELLAPGVGPPPLWRPAAVDVGRAPDTDMYGAVARKP
ncbi:SAM-dependent methyltransferase [Nocardiopsis kunsanensis]|uniref:S-adenosyl methyltransferase n=1 Tax=Nocardiopsis kunsanensis TaxID=141693 RepID=A0A918X6W6_9ACTN|nr:SAM-dependent methyltransferase [Nocardiopsis kunsanensis]GHD15791.1 hypothetical protein GCM10007147_03580 [Nocardiopsis kunsanensis]